MMCGLAFVLTPPSRSSEAEERQTAWAGEIGDPRGPSLFDRLIILPNTLPPVAQSSTPLDP
jgi:hypothetical protein